MPMSDAVITVTIPSDTRFVALARLTGAGLGAELDFDVDTIDDLRMATNELVAVVVEWAADNGRDTVTLTFTLDGAALDVHASAGEFTDGAQPVELDPLTEQILASVADSYELGPSWGSLRKARAATA
jgi:hypothetical protein